MKPSYALKIKNLTVSYMENVALKNIHCSVEKNQLIGVIGPNGGGKSTLMKAIMGLVPVDRGSIEILGKPLKNAYRRLAYVPQKNSLDPSFPLLVEDMVMQGRFPHIPWWSFPRAEDRKIVKQALVKVGMEAFSRRQIGKLSGGQLQRVLMARALAQEAEVFFLDEPFSGIDVSSENKIMQVLKELKAENKTVFVVHHDLSKVDAYFDSLILLNNELVAAGSSYKVLQPNNLKKAYQEINTLTLIQNNIKEVT